MFYRRAAEGGLTGSTQTQSFQSTQPRPVMNPMGLPWTHSQRLTTAFSPRSWHTQNEVGSQWLRQSRVFISSSVWHPGWPFPLAAARAIMAKSTMAKAGRKGVFGYFIVDRSWRSCSFTFHGCAVVICSNETRLNVCHRVVVNLYPARETRVHSRS